eukprot:TRINITY_DN111904_c0_g1_i1.p1 TRINITY_DN111904_c0_g1~~TRINITY_DN111904_c0_g1_i1.p1  ORF type:complete len:171 (-),score=23.40 TRINITY_DN111904_c0_g1_i1:135-581(-)
MAAAVFNVLAAFGKPVGHKQIVAAYSTGLLLTRRALQHFDLQDKLNDKEELNCEEYHVEDRPFKGILESVTDSGEPRRAQSMENFIFHTTPRTSQVFGLQMRRGKMGILAQRHNVQIFGNLIGECMEMPEDENPTKCETHLYTRLFLK